MKAVSKNRTCVALTLAAVFLLAGCDHLTEPIDGPRLIDRFGDFSLIEPLGESRPSVDFAAGESVAFTARFNKQVNWVLEITGQTSGAVKRFEDFSDELTDANALWRGGTTELPFFGTEICDVALIIPDEEVDTLRTIVEVLSVKEYEGNVAADFNEDAGSDIFVGNFEFELDASSGLSAEVRPAEGEFFYLLRGTDDVVNNFFVGLIDIKATITGETYFPVPTSVPEDLYFNMFLYSFGTPNTIAVVQLVFDENGSGAFEDGQDQVFAYGDIVVDWVGWQHFHKPMSELGLTQAQVQELVAIRVLLISDNNAQPSPPLPVDYGIDYLTFTAGGPLQL